MIKNRISAATERRKEIEAAKQRPDLGEGEERVYVLLYMSVTFPTSHVERSQLKSPAYINTAPQKSFKDKNGLKKKEERALLKNRISAPQKEKKREK